MGKLKIDVQLQEETEWLKQIQMAELFDKSKKTISQHINNVFKEGELDKMSTSRKYRTPQIEGGRNVEREIDNYNLDFIISVDYRVKSQRSTQFRIQVNNVLKEYLVK